VPASKQTKILPVLVTPAKKVSSKAVVHLADVALWPVKDLREWAQRALVTVREARKTFVEAGDLVWRAKVAELFKENGLSARPLFEKLRKNSAAKRLKLE
jgi:hypothetical protein